MELFEIELFDHLTVCMESNALEKSTNNAKHKSAAFEETVMLAMKLTFQFIVRYY